jgi:hypothetical protein
LAGEFTVGFNHKIKDDHSPKPVFITFFLTFFMIFWKSEG